jgi:hypothetical protein
MPVVMPLIDGSGPLRALSFTQVMVTDTAVGFVIPVVVVPRYVVMTIHTNALRVRWDGGTPTTTLGHQLTIGSGAPGDVSKGFELTGVDAIRNFRMCRSGSADAEVAYTLFG